MPDQTARAQWNARFGSDGYLYGTDPNDFLRHHVGMLPPGEVMCLAEGQGRNAVFLAEQGYQVSSVDLSITGVEKTLALARAKGVTGDAAAADRADADLGISRWSAIVSIFAHVPPAIRANVHRQVADALIPEGVFLLEAYTPNQVGRGTGGPPDGAAGNPPQRAGFEMGVHEGQDDGQHQIMGKNNRAVRRFLSDHGVRYCVDRFYCDFYGRNVTWNPNGYLRRIATGSASFVGPNGTPQRTRPIPAPS